MNYLTYEPEFHVYWNYGQHTEFLLYALITGGSFVYAYKNRHKYCKLSKASSKVQCRGAV